MSDVAIRVEGLSKRYQLGERQSYKALRDTLTAAMTEPVRRLRARSGHLAATSARDETLWALRDVSCEIRRGEVVGIIGRNGSGKSTLLKILSRITGPTAGRAYVTGRVGSLLEVGTGFHPELTGRDNIFLNGAILGMRRIEIVRKFDEIVAFADIDRFVDTPVKRYSSGMYVRLAFAVAAHLEPEILLVDEVLAVGDSAFQKKCLGKMNDVARGGRTVLFVSHDMTNVAVLCDSALLLGKGKLIARGPTQKVIDSYVSQGTDRRSSVTWDPETAPGDAVTALRHVDVRTAEGLPTGPCPLSQPVEFRVEYEVFRDHSRINPVFAVKNLMGTTIFTTANYEDQDWGTRLYRPGSYLATCRVPSHVFNDGTYLVDVLLVEDARFVRAIAEGAIEFSVYDDGASRGGYVGPWHGIVRPRCEWSAGELT